MANYQLPLVVDYMAEEGRIPLPLKIAVGDHLVEVIGAGTKVPIRRVVEVSNAEENQDSLKIRVVQGASNRIEANAVVGTYVIGGLPAATIGELAISLAFEVTPSLGFNLKASSGDRSYEIELVSPGKPLGGKAIAALMDEEDRDEPVEFDGVYDRAEYHAQSIAEEELPAEQAYVHAGMFVAWLIEKSLLDDEFATKAVADTEAFTQRQLSGPQLYKKWQGVLSSDMLGEEGNAFAMAYFDFHRGHYLEDYGEVLAPESATLFAVEDSWENYDRLAKRLHHRYAEWQTKRSRKHIKWEQVREPSKSAGAAQPRDGQA